MVEERKKKSLHTEEENRYRFSNQNIFAKQADYRLSSALSELQTRLIRARYGTVVANSLPKLIRMPTSRQSLEGVKAMLTRINALEENSKIGWDRIYQKTRIIISNINSRVAFLAALYMYILYLVWSIASGNFR